MAINVMSAYLQSVYQPYLRSSAPSQSYASSGSNTPKLDTFEKSDVSQSQSIYYNYDKTAVTSKDNDSGASSLETDDKSTQGTEGGESGGSSSEDSKVTRKIVTRNGIKFLEITTTYSDGRKEVESQVLSGQDMRKKQTPVDNQSPLAKLLTM